MLKIAFGHCCLLHVTVYLALGSRSKAMVKGLSQRARSNVRCVQVNIWGSACRMQQKTTILIKDAHDTMQWLQKIGYRKLRLAEDFEKLRLAPDFENQNQASDVIFCDHVSDVQYESGYVPV